MNNLIGKLKSISKVQIVAVILIVIGLAIMIPKAKGMLNFYKEARYATDNDFAAGNPSPDLLRPWMSIRYIAVAYGVPQKYLFDTANIQPHRESSMVSLNRLNRQLGLGQIDGQPAVMNIIRDAIISYRASPVATGMIEQHVEGWMTVQYIANSTGIPAETLLAETGITLDRNAFKPLDFLCNEVKYPGGPKALVAVLQKVVDEQGIKP